MEELDLSVILSIFRRKGRLFALTSGVVFLLGIGFTLGWSNYKAEATIEIAEPDVPENITALNGADLQRQAQSLASMRISRIQQKVLSTGSLAEIIAKYGLYGEARASVPIAALADRMRKKVSVDFVTDSMGRAAGGTKAADPIAFKISFRYMDPLKTQQVTNELMGRFLDADLREKREQTKQITSFLDGQVKALEASLGKQEEEIAAFRSKHGGIRPEMLAFNQQAAEQLNARIAALESQITTNLGTQGALKARLAATDPYARVMAERPDGGGAHSYTSPRVLLKALKSDFATASAKYGQKHPDVLRLKRQIEALEEKTGPLKDTADLEKQIVAINTTLKAEEKTYGPKNPEVLSLKKQKQKLEQRLEKERALPDTKGAPQDADNPAYLEIRTELASTEEQYRALQTEKRGLMADQNKYKAAIILNPEVEKEFASLSRDYENSKIRYRELKAKQQAAEMAETVQKDRSGQKLEVINPPDLPLHTTPSKIILILASLVAALFSGAGVAIAEQMMSGRIINANHLTALTGVAPLIVFPHIVTIEERVARKKQRKRIVLGLALAFLALVGLALSRMPYDVMTTVIANKIGLN